MEPTIFYSNVIHNNGNIIMYRNEEGHALLTWSGQIAMICERNLFNWNEVIEALHSEIFIIRKELGADLSAKVKKLLRQQHDRLECLLTIIQEEL